MTPCPDPARPAAACAAECEAACAAEDDAAAVILVLAALTAPAPPSRPAERPLWGSPAHQLGLLSNGPRSWWASGLPR